ncbi:MAG: hypothetical protein QOG04_1304 [Actinomycetota bacterium]|jgi:hypothetical protein|nr:hypothetical protein [Actinomycetota bacterium]
MSRKLITLLCAALIALAACGGGGGEKPAAKSSGSRFGDPFTDAKAYPVFASSEIVVGENRFLVGLLDENDAPIGSRSIAMHIDFYDRASSETEPVFGTDMDFIETIPGERGLYVTTAKFDEAGSWGAAVTVTGDGLDETVNAAFDVAESGSTPEIGAPAPASDTFTAADVDNLSEISTDPHPDPDFYRESIKQAIARKEPFVVVFATPKFCTSQVCAPTLNIVKAASKSMTGVTFIHVEVYKNLDDPGHLVPVKAVREWGLPSEPWVFVVDANGKVAAKYEGTVTAGELEAVLKKL